MFDGDNGLYRTMIVGESRLSGTIVAGNNGLYSIMVVGKMDFMVPCMVVGENGL